MKRIFIIITIAAFCVSWGIRGPEAKFFTDPSIPLEQSDWDGKKKSVVPADEYKYKEEKKEEQPEEVKKEKKKKEKKKKKSSSSQIRDKFQFGLKAGYNVLSKTEVTSGGSSFEPWSKGENYSVDLGMEFIVNILGGHIGLGLGVSSTIDYHNDEYTDTIVYVPVYGIIKGYLFKGHSPFVSLSLGYNIYTEYFTNNDTIIPGDTSGGLHFSVGGGFISKGGLQIEIQYVISRASMDINGTDYDAEHSHLSIGIAKFF